MYISQVWSIWYDTNSRYHVRHGFEHLQRESLHFPVVLVYNSHRIDCFWIDI